MRLAAVALLCALALGACTSTNDKPKEDLATNVRAFHNHMRWARYHEASAYLQAADQEAFLGRHEELGDDWRVVEYEIKAVRVTRPDEEAEAEIEVQWIREPDMRVHKDKIIEVWRNLDGHWRVVERRVIPKD